MNLLDFICLVSKMHSEVWFKRGNENLIRNLIDGRIISTYRVTLVVANLGWVDLNLPLPLSAQLCCGQWGFGRIGWVAKQDDETSKIKATQPRFATTSVTLYMRLFE